MRYNFLVLVTISWVFVNHSVASEQESNNNSVFIPTTEWQTVKKGTPIPKGLHIRHNFQTGITEAKLLEPDDTGSTNEDTQRSLALHPDTPEVELSGNDDIKTQEGDNRVKISEKELKSKLKEIKSSKAELPAKTGHTDVPEPGSDFQSYNKLKEKFGNISIGKSTDTDLLNSFIKQFNTHREAIISGTLKDDEVKVIMDILSQLEYLVHDIDNGLEFTKSGGLTNVIYPCLNGTMEEIKYEALRVLGAAVQSNPKAKETALELEFVPSILRTLARHGSSKIMDRCIYALGSLVRHYPAAQKVFLRHGGFEIFSQVLAEGPVSTQKRILNLVNDWIVERQNVQEINDIESRKLKILEYDDVEFEGKIVQHKLCAQLTNLLIKLTNNEIKTEFNVDDHDLLEATYQCALSASNICRLEFRQNQNQILTALNEISLFYKSLYTQFNSDENEFFQHLLTLVEKLKETIFDKSHDEL